MTTARRQAYTLMEVLVVIAIFAVLVALLLPAVQKAREAAARAACANNLRQIGLALHQYEGTNGFFPACGYTKPNPLGHSWATHLLPYVEQNTLYSLMNLSIPVNAPNNLSAIQTPEKIFQCPSANQPRTSEFFWTLPGISFGSARLATTDYAPVFGISRDLAPFLPPGTAVGSTGSLLLDHPARIAQITDGLSNTIIIAEDAGRPQRWQLGKLLSSPATPSPGGGWGDPANGFWVHGITGNLSSSTQSLCLVNCDNCWGIYSFHMGGANVLMGDGHVSLLPNAIRPEVLAALVSRSAGDIAETP